MRLDRKYNNPQLLKKQYKLKSSLLAESILKNSKAKKESYVNLVDYYHDAYISNNSEILSDVPSFSLYPVKWFVHQIYSSCNVYKKDFNKIKSLLYAIKKTGLVDSLNPREVNDSLWRQLVKIIINSDSWIRNPLDWHPKSHNIRKQFSSLVRFLFAKYDVPLFMDSAWFQDSDKYISWFIKIGQGVSLKSLDFPFTYTKKMAYHFLQAPNNYTVDQAIRWGQIHAMGGNERLVEAIIGSVLIRKNYKNEEFWTTVIQFFINNPLLDLVHVSPIIDYIDNQKFQLVQINDINDNFNRVIQPAQPNFTMKGRNPENLLQEVDNWHKATLKNSQGPTDWKSCNIPGWNFTEGQNNNLKIFTINELLSKNELIKEGKAMSHCVSSYSYSCDNGTSAIYSLKCEAQASLQRLLTIEVDVRNKLIVQARGKYNDPPDQVSVRIMRLWAQSVGLKISKWI